LQGGLSVLVEPEVYVRPGGDHQRRGLEPPRPAAGPACQLLEQRASPDPSEMLRRIYEQQLRVPGNELRQPADIPGSDGFVASRVIESLFLGHFTEFGHSYYFLYGL
jgi:hypothetical protein